MTDLTTICADLGLPAPEEVEALRPGTAASVRRLRCAGRDYLLRSLAGPRQAETEARIVAHLRARGFLQTPELLGAAERGGVWYQLQRYVAGTMPDPSIPGAPEAVAATAKALTAALADCPEDAAPEDGFDLAGTWAAYRGFWDRLPVDLPLDEADAAVADCVRTPDRETRVIHGDLGLWNLLRDADGTLWVIDFGAARRGDPYYDCAAALGGILNHSPAEVREANARCFLTALDADGVRLREQLRLWAWRGLAQCAAAAGRGEPFARFAPKFLAALRTGTELLH